jgi:hypothetical protein
MPEPPPVSKSVKIFDAESQCLGALMEPTGAIHAMRIDQKGAGSECCI